MIAIVQCSCSACYTSQNSLEFSSILDGHNGFYSAEMRVSQEWRIFNISPACIPSYLSQGKAHTVFYLGECTTGIFIFCYLGVLDYQNIFEISTSVPYLTKIDQRIQKLVEKNRQTDAGPINLVIRLKKGFFP